MTSKEIIKQLKFLSNSENIEGMKRFACGGAKTLGISLPVLRKMAKEINHEYTNLTNNTNKNVIAKPTSSRLKQSNTDRHSRQFGIAITKKHKLAFVLWDSGYHEARILASMIDESSLVTERQMDSWVADFDSWDVCDQVCMNLFWQTPFAYQKAIKWATLPHLHSRSVNAGAVGNENKVGEFQKRASFAMMAVLAWKDKNAIDNDLKQFFPIIIREATDERNFVKKAVNWALRQIGKSRPSLRQPALDTAYEILKKYPDLKSARWIANDTIKELINRKDK